MLIKHKAKLFLDFLIYFKKKSSYNRISTIAGHLSYITLLGIVPFFTIFAAVFSYFPTFDQLFIQIQSFIVSNFVPASSEIINSHLTELLANAKKMTALGFVFLIVIALFLMRAIDKSINLIWETKKHRPILMSFSIYWMILTLSPLILGASILITSTFILEIFTKVSSLKLLFILLPFLLSSFLFLLLYLLVPNVKVSFKHAFFGAVFTANLLEISKYFFRIYIDYFSAYHTIYGAIASIPILFVWIYITWFLVLLGAEFTAILGRFDLK